MNFSYLKTFIAIFALGFFLNLLWENLHSHLYVEYRGSPITEIILVRASLFDATFISLLGVFFVFIPYLRERKWLVFAPAVLFAIGLEMFALSTGRWSYNEFMPIIPYLNVGLTPTIQLGLTAYLTYLYTLKTKV